ncbi:MAG: NAD-dependent epimerase/dehydratase family protein [Paludibacteraceae bacterium]|nr:NAD-dependent epimerase/dehydratase family protein [Paludibacteraceae bacterium]
MKALFIGGTGTISMAITRSLAKNPDWELYLLNRGTRSAELPSNVKVINVADVNDEAAVAKAIGGMTFDTVCDFICFHKEQVERDIRLFKGNTRQFMVISSASTYQKPLSSHIVNEATPLANPYWQYSREKIEIEERLMQEYRSNGFPITIIRPSHTYDERSIPLGVHGKNGSYQVIKRMLEGKQVIVHGDGTSLWTMTHNSDFAKGFIGLMGNIHAIGESFQITSDEVLTWNQVYQSIADALGVEFKPCYVASSFLASVSDYNFTGSLIGDKANSVVFDCSKLKRAVPSYCTTTRFDQGVRRTIANVLATPSLQRLDPEFDAWCDKVIEAMEMAKKMVIG